jgi:hypothetical protein
MGVIQVLITIALCIYDIPRKLGERRNCNNETGDHGDDDSENVSNKEYNHDILVSEADAEPFELSPDELEKAQIPEQYVAQ